MRGPNLNSVGLILASTFGLEVAQHLAYGTDKKEEGAILNNASTAPGTETVQIHSKNEGNSTNETPKVQFNIESDPITTAQSEVIQGKSSLRVTVILLKNSVANLVPQFVRLLYINICRSNESFPNPLDSKSQQIIA